jgi:hypothetical protein
LSEKYFVQNKNTTLGINKKILAPEHPPEMIHPSINQRDGARPNPSSWGQNHETMETTGLGLFQVPTRAAGKKIQNTLKTRSILTPRAKQGKLHQALI